MDTPSLDDLQELEVAAALDAAKMDEAMSQDLSSVELEDDISQDLPLLEGAEALCSEKIKIL